MSPYVDEDQSSRRQPKKRKPTNRIVIEPNLRTIKQKR